MCFSLDTWDIILCPGLWSALMSWISPTNDDAWSNVSHSQVGHSMTLGRDLWRWHIGSFLGRKFRGTVLLLDLFDALQLFDTGTSGPTFTRKLVLLSVSQFLQRFTNWVAVCWIVFLWLETSVVTNRGCLGMMVGVDVRKLHRLQFLAVGASVVLL